MSETTLPDDVIDFLRRAAETPANEYGRYDVDTEAAELVTKYAPQPETVADHGKLQYARILQPLNPGECARSETDSPAGLSFESSDGILPWPEVEGIDPLPLLNSGYQLLAFADVPDDWYVAVHGLALHPIKCVRRTATTALTHNCRYVVLACPPGDEAPTPEMSALTKTALNRENPR